MSRERRDDRLGLGFILIAAGIAWLLFQMNIISFSIFSALSVLWPGIFVVIGLNIIFHRVPFISVLTWGLFLVALVVFGGGVKSVDQVAEKIGIEREEDTSYAERVELNWDYTDSSVGWSDLTRDEGFMARNQETLNKALLKLDFGAGNVSVAGGSEKMITFDVPEAYTEVKEETGDTTAKYSFRTKKNLGFNFGNGEDNEYHFKLNEEAEWELDLDTGAMNANLDLRDIHVSQAKVDTGAGNVDIAFGSKAKQLDVEIDSGVADITIRVPKDVGVKIELDGLIGDDFSDLGFIKDKDVWTSDNYDTATSLVHIEVDVGVGNVDLILE